MQEWSDTGLKFTKKTELVIIAMLVMVIIIATGSAHLHCKMDPQLHADMENKKEPVTQLFG